MTNTLTSDEREERLKQIRARQVRCMRPDRDDVPQEPHVRAYYKELRQAEMDRGVLLSLYDELQSQLAQVTQERDALRNSASIVAFQAHQIDRQIATSLMDNARKQCVKRVREYLTDCRDEETGIIEAIALDLESLIPQQEQP